MKSKFCSISLQIIEKFTAHIHKSESALDPAGRSRSYRSRFGPSCTANTLVAFSAYLIQCNVMYIPIYKTEIKNLMRFSGKVCL